MLAGDSRGAIGSSILEDPRVQTFWDGDRIVGDWFGTHAVGGLGGDGYTVWDAFFAFDGQAGWDRQPTRAVAAGATIIGNTDALERQFVPLLG